MKISLKWLQDFLDITEEPASVGEKLTLVGLALDGMEQNGDDTVFELDITANRGDCLSHLGVARELAVIYDVDIRKPAVDVPKGTAADVFSISIADPDLCNRYCGRYISGITIGPSPDWMAQRLEAVGIRPINNVTDITNYVLMELGHPLHAFDADMLQESKIIVRRAREGETIRTLDGEDRKLESSMLVIADANRPVALAGIMGGLDTETSEKTTNVLLESAWFNPISVRTTGGKVNLGTEASYRFERGTDINMAAVALNRAAMLVLELAGGTAHRGIIDVHPQQWNQTTVSLRRDRILSILGSKIPDSHVQRIFTRLGFEPTDESGDGWMIKVPSHRHDIKKEEDLLEEVARHYGYGRFPSRIPSWAGQGRFLAHHGEEKLVRDTLAGLGYSETCSLAFSNFETEDRFAPGVKPITIRNPLSEKAPILRTTLVPSVLGSLLWNLNRGIRNLSLYEMGKVYPSSGEYRQLVVAATGATRQQSIHQSRVEADFYNLKGDIESLLERFAVNRDVSNQDLPLYYHPGRAVRLGTIAVLGELHAEYEEMFKLRQKTYVAEIAIEELFAAGLKKIAAAAIPKYPAVRRDLSLLVNRKNRYAEIIAAVRQAKIRELVEVTPFDRLERGSFSDTCYSLAITMVFQSAERTLTDTEVQEFEERILVELLKIDVELRS